VSSERAIVEDFIESLIERAEYGIRGEKPLAIIAALQYVYENKLAGKKLLELFEYSNRMKIHTQRRRTSFHSDKIRTYFIDLANRCGSIKNPSGSWGVITGTNGELQSAILEFRYVNRSFAGLTMEDIGALLKEYLNRLSVHDNEYH